MTNHLILKKLLHILSFLFVFSGYFLNFRELRQCFDIKVKLESLKNFAKISFSSNTASYFAHSNMCNNMGGKENMEYYLNALIIIKLLHYIQHLGAYQSIFKFEKHIKFH